MKINGYLRLLAAAIVGTIALMASENHGMVTLGGLPVPGVTVTATQGERKMTAVTDGMGTYSFPDLNDGVWTIQVEMSGFTPLKQDITVGPNSEASKWELKIKSLSEIQAEVQSNQLTEQRSAPAAAANTARPAAKGQAQTQAKAQAAGGRGGTPAGQTQAVAEAPPADDSASRAADGFLVNGSQVNGGASPFALNPAFGNNRRGPRSLYTYQLTFTLDNSATDATPYSLTGQPAVKPSYNNYTLNGLIQGPLRIPHILRNGPTFFVQYNLARNRNDSTSPALFPTQAERNGDLSALSGPITNPYTGQLFANNQIPQNLINPQAAALLNLYPLPNFTGSSIYNYQIPIVGLTHSDGFITRMNKQIGRKNSIQGVFALTSTRGSTPSVFGFVDTNDTLGMNFDPIWRHQFTPRMSSTLELQVTRNAAHAYSFFSNSQNISGNAGITGNDQNPLYWGPPSLSLGASNITGLGDASPSFNRQTFETLKSDSTWNHGRHNVTFGGDVRWQQFNYNSESNARGLFSFTGAAAGSPGTPAGAFADFLLGIPDTSTLAYGNPDKYLRARNYDLYATDDWKVNSAITLNLTLRYEYNAPVSEEYGRLVNLDVAPGFSTASPVLGTDPRGPLTQMGYPTSLIRPERWPFEPGLGFAWRPISGSSLIVRGGYSMRFANPGYSGIAASMFQQYPFSNSINGLNSPSTPLTLANGFIGTPGISQDTFGIDPNFQESYVQTWQLSLQKDLPAGMQTVIQYQGVKGTRLPQFFYPNSYPFGGVDPCPACLSGYVYETSNGNSSREAGSVQLRRRLHNGFTAQALYTYSKAIDDTNTQGQAAQNWLNLAAERGLSTFDQRHNVQGQLQYTSGMGLHGGSLISGWRAAVLKEWTFLTSPTWGSGLPETPIYPELLGGTSRGAMRPNYTGQPLYAGATGGRFLNQYAFAAPAPGTYGNAGVGVITGPAQFSLNGALQRTFRVNDRVTFNFRADVNNVLNHVVFTAYNTTLGPQFGAASGVNGMRSVRITGQFRF